MMALPLPLLLLFLLKHSICDFWLQGEYMIGKFKEYPDFIKPLLAHVTVHAIGTFIIASFYVSVWQALFLALFDMTIHFTMDRIKASPNLLGRYKYMSGAEYVEATKKREALQKWIRQCEDQGLYDELEIREYDLSQVETKFKNNRKSWLCLDLDQNVHHLTHFAIICMIVNWGGL